MPKILQYRFNLSALIMYSIEVVKDIGNFVYHKDLKSIPRSVAVHSFTTIWVPEGWIVKFSKVPATVTISYFFTDGILKYHLDNLDEFPTKVGIQLVEDRKKYSEMLADQTDEHLVNFHIKRSSVPEVTDEYLTTKQAAEFLQVKPETMRNWNYFKKIPFVKVGRSVRYKLSDLTEFAQQRKKL